MAFTSPRNRERFSPARKQPKDLANSLHRVHSHPEEQTVSFESPSRQLVIEFQKLWSDQDRSQQSQLDAQLELQAERHREALAQAALEHDRIRKNAEIARERVELEIERERKRRETEEKDRLERERQAKVNREAEERKQERELVERRQREQTAKIEEERRIEKQKADLEEQKRRAAEEAEAAAQQKQASEAAAKAKAREAVAKAAKAREDAQKAAAAAQQAPAAGPTSSPSVSAAPKPAAAQAQPNASTASQAAADPVRAEFEAVHKRYLELHTSLKQMREHVTVEGKKIPALKAKIGDWRREIVKCMGQLTADKTKNRKPMLQIQAVLSESLKYSDPSIDVSPYLIGVANPTPGQPIPFSGVFIYLLNIFSKSIIGQFISETSGGAKSADPVGVVAVSIFANALFKLNGNIPFIDILLAKYHKTCPLLFGISAGQTTIPGRVRIGWRHEAKNRPPGPRDFVPEQRHLERMSGLATGWAALTLRDFSKSKNENPLPNYHYWRAVAGVGNTASADMGSSHATVLKSLIDGFVPRFIGFYGGPAKAALRVALVDLPERIKKEKSGDAAAVQAANGLEVLREVLQRDVKLILV